MKPFLLGALGALVVAAAFELGDRNAAKRQAKQDPHFVLHEFTPRRLTGGVAGADEAVLLRMNDRTGETRELSMDQVPIALTGTDGRNVTQRVIAWSPVGNDVNESVHDLWRQFGSPAPRK